MSRLFSKANISHPGFWILCAALIVLTGSLTVVAQRAGANAGKNGILRIPVAAFIVDIDNGNNKMSSQRSVASMEEHFQDVNKVWSQAGIEIDPVMVKRISVPRNLLHDLIHKRGRGGIANFFRAIQRQEINLGRESNALMWSFYVKSLGGPNGLKPQGIDAIFVVDQPANNDYRVTSHEIAHVLGLYHARRDSNKLLYSGSNGLALDEAEKTVARYNAQRILRGMARL